MCADLLCVHLDMEDVSLSSPPSLKHRYVNLNVYISQPLSSHGFQPHTNDIGVLLCRDEILFSEGLIYNISLNFETR